MKWSELKKYYNIDDEWIDDTYMMCIPKEYIIIEAHDEAYDVDCKTDVMQLVKEDDGTITVIFITDDTEYPIIIQTRKSDIDDVELPAYVYKRIDVD